MQRKERKKKESPYGGKVTGGAMHHGSEERKNRRRDQIQLRRRKGEKRGRKKLTMAFDAGEWWRVGACVRGSGVRRRVGACGSVRRRCALGAGEREEERGKEEE